MRPNDQGTNSKRRREEASRIDNLSLPPSPARSEAAPAQEAGAEPGAEPTHAALSPPERQEASFFFPGAEPGAEPTHAALSPPERQEASFFFRSLLFRPRQPARSEAAPAQEAGAEPAAEPTHAALSPLEGLPQELLVSVLGRLDREDIARLCATNHGLRRSVAPLLPGLGCMPEENAILLVVAGLDPADLAEALRRVREARRTVPKIGEVFPFPTLDAGYVEYDIDVTCLCHEFRRSVGRAASDSGVEVMRLRRVRSHGFDEPPGGLEGGPEELPIEAGFRHLPRVVLHAKGAMRTFNRGSVALAVERCDIEAAPGSTLPACGGGREATAAAAAGGQAADSAAVAGLVAQAELLGYSVVPAAAPSELALVQFRRIVRPKVDGARGRKVNGPAEGVRLVPLGLGELRRGPPPVVTPVRVTQWAGGGAAPQQGQRARPGWLPPHLRPKKDAPVPAGFVRVASTDDSHCLFQAAAMGEELPEGGGRPPEKSWGGPALRLREKVALLLASEEGRGLLEANRMLDEGRVAMGPGRSPVTLEEYAKRLGYTDPKRGPVITGGWIVLLALSKHLGARIVLHVEHGGGEWRSAVADASRPGAGAASIGPGLADAPPSAGAAAPSQAAGPPAGTPAGAGASGPGPAGPPEEVGAAIHLLFDRGSATGIKLPRYDLLVAEGASARG
eukprot:tig00000863_g4988.t1